MAAHSRENTPQSVCRINSLIAGGGLPAAQLSALLSASMPLCDEDRAEMLPEVRAIRRERNHAARARDTCPLEP